MNRRDFLGTAAVGVTGALVALADSGTQPEPPNHLHELNRHWVMHPDPSIRFWSGDVKRLTPNLTLIKTGGHFDGFQVMHWSRSRDGNGVLLVGDQPDLCMDRNWVTFMYSYPNYIPLNGAAIQGIVAALNPYSRIHRTIFS